MLAKQLQDPEFLIPMCANNKFINIYIRVCVCAHTHISKQELQVQITKTDGGWENGNKNQEKFQELKRSQLTELMEWPEYWMEIYPHQSTSL